MKTRNSALFALGLAAAITLGGAVTASAQDTTTRARPQRRIPVRKEGPAPAQPARVDTVTITRTDTVVRTRTDTVTVTRVDTVTRIEELPLQPLKSVQFGIFAGMDIPTAAWLTVAKLGYTTGINLGFFPGASPLGLRLGGAYSIFPSRDTDCPNCSSTKLIAGNADIVLRFPLDRKSKVNPIVYFLGGGGIDKFSDFNPYRTGTRNSITVTAGKDTYLQYPGIPLTAATAGDKSLFYHYDFGGGIQLGHFFVESKYVSVNTTGGNSVHVPVVIGLNF
jgi:hypothetical protein